MMNIIIATTSSWLDDESYQDLCSDPGKVFILKSREQLSIDFFNRINPKYVFFPHWSYIIPAAIYEKFNCVIFHMTDLPFGRGGSPLQNLIARKIVKTKISAIKCVKDLDAGPIYLKEHLGLLGSAQEIYERANKIIIEMIRSILKSNIQPIEQTGKVVTFKRRTPDQSEIKDIHDPNSLYDHIRMLDADGYPRAFLNYSGFRFEFSKSSINQEGDLIAEVKIRKDEES